VETRRLVVVGEEGHDDGLDSRVEAAVLARCLSSLGTGNDETGSVGLSGFSVGWSCEPLVAHCALLGGNREVVASSTAIARELNIALEETGLGVVEPISADSAHGT
jgi:hypothetical protein